MHETYMKRAISEALKGKGQTFTNPLVGAVIVKDEEIVAVGSHMAYGQPHAEKNAIDSCSSPEKLIDSTIYVTLEPCHHYGKQPPCTTAILQSGIKKVVIGQLDPNPLVSGKGKAFLESQGVAVITGVLEKEVREINRYYNTYHEEQRPFVALKQATTLDGKIALAGQRTRITGEAALRRVRQERSDYQAILIGSRTALIDNPTLRTEAAFPTYRVVLDRKGETLKQQLTLFEDTSSPVLVFTTKKVQSVFSNHVNIITTPSLTLSFVMKELYRRKIQSVYVEGGSSIHDAFLADGYWDQVITYLSPKLIGGNGTASFASSREVNQMFALTEVTVEPVGEELRIVGRRQENVYRTHSRKG